MIQATNKLTGEMIELDIKNLEQLTDAWKLYKSYKDFADELHNKLKKIVPKYIDARGTSEECGGYMFRVSNIQRKNYDKSVLREVFDEDTLDLFLKPDKTAIDNYLKENLEELGDNSTKLRQSMVDDGRMYEVIKMEKVFSDTDHENTTKTESKVEQLPREDKRQIKAVEVI